NSPIPAFRGRLRTSVDTLFLSELSQEKAPKTLSLEELLGRVRPKKPAVIKAKSLNLVRVEREEPVLPPPATPRLPNPVPLPVEDQGEIGPPPAVRVTKTPAPRFPADPSPKSEQRSSAFSGIWIIAVILVVGGIFGVLLLSTRSLRESEPSRTAANTIPSPVESSWPPPAVATIVAPTPEVPASEVATPVA